MTELRNGLARSPLKWLLLYVAAIPLFAAWYVALAPHSLRDSNAEFEASLHRDGLGLLPELTAMMRLTKSAPSTWAVSGARLEIVPGTVRADGLEHTNDGSFRIRVEGVYRASRHDARWTGRFWQWIELSHEAQEVKRRGSNDTYFGYEVAQASDLGLLGASASSPPIAFVFPPAAEKHAISRPGVGLLAVTPAFNERLTHFYDAAEGDPAYASGAWLRAMYVSSTTLTTLGLGDITPVSNEARLAMGIEAPVGIVILGLFLNALASRRRAIFSGQA